MRKFVSLLGMIALATGCRDSPGSQNSESNPTSSPDSVTLSPPAPIGIEESAESILISGAPRRNRYLQLQVYDAGFDLGSPPPPPGLRYLVAGLRGTSRSTNNVVLEIERFVFAQNDRGCISIPMLNLPWLKQPLDSLVTFTSDQSTAGQLAFLVPKDTQQVRILIAPAGGDGFVVSAGDEFTPNWPTPINTIDDGSVLRVLLLPRPNADSSLPSTTGHENVVLDFVIENLSSAQGIEFTTSQQLRLLTPDGRYVQPSVLTKQVGCRLDDGDVVPPGHARRLMAVYEFPSGVPKRLEYRGFEVEAITVDIE